MKLGVPIDDERICVRYAQQGKQPCTLGKFQPSRIGQLPGGLMPSQAEIWLRPEFDRFRLFWRSLSTSRSPQSLRLIIVASILGASQWRWRSGPELVRSIKAPRLGLSVLRGNRRRSWNPDSRCGDRPVNVWDSCLVIGAVGNYFGPSGRARRLPA